MATDDATNQGQAAWQDELVALLGEIEAAHTPRAEAAIFTRVTELAPELQIFLLEHMAAQDTSEAAAFVASLAAHANTPDAVRTRASEELAALAARGITPAAPDVESFDSGWAQLGRERGEQIMLLGWRLADGRMEAFVFLLDWHGDGLKDFYRTREISDAEWHELLEHNGEKGAALVEISLAEGRALLEDALSESHRFSRPVPREYKLAQQLVRQRVVDTAEPAAAHRSYVTPDLAPEDMAKAYARALHYRDYALIWELMVLDGHSIVSGDETTRAQAIDALRREWKHAPRRRPNATATIEAPAKPEDLHRSVLLEGEAETVERTGRRVRTRVRERIRLDRTLDGWRIAAIESLGS